MNGFQILVVLVSGASRYYYRSVLFCRQVYKDLLARGDIVERPEVTPPTVPMDYNWARVSSAVYFWSFIASSIQCLWLLNIGLALRQMDTVAS